ncbi:unnamed protein product, partial [Cyprideis torosa]
RFKDVFPELAAQQDFVKKVILEEEKSFLRTLEGGLKRIDSLQIDNGILDGQTTFELYDTYGFPIDLTRLICEDKQWTVDEKGFEIALQEQKDRSKADAKRETGDWTQVRPGQEVTFVGYDDLSTEESYILKYRTIKIKDKPVYQLVLDKTPFYAEGGGQKMTDEELLQVEQMVNQKVRENIRLEEARSIAIEEAKSAGAMMLFGEKYGETVRMITFDPQYSREVCGGCHVDATGEIGFFKIVSESAIAAGVRRIEAITAEAAERYIQQQIEELVAVKSSLKNPKDIIKSVADLQDENRQLKKELEVLKLKQAGSMQDDLIASAKEIAGA